MFPLVAYRTGTSESRSELNGASNGTVVALFSRLLQRIIGRGAERATQFLVSGDTKIGFSRTFDDAGPPSGTPVFFFQGILGRSRPEIGRLHRKCGRTEK